MIRVFTRTAGGILRRRRLKNANRKVNFRDRTRMLEQSIPTSMRVASHESYVTVTLSEPTSGASAMFACTVT